MSPHCDDVSTIEIAAFERALVGFVRSFGLHHADETPCGEPIPVSEAHAIAALADGPISQRELGERLMLTKGTVSRIVDLLSQRGWVQRTQSEHDARAVEIRLTTSGRAAAKRLSKRRAVRLTALLNAIPASERANVVHALTRLTEAARD